ncbi:TPA: hypothetical protein I7783_02315 [Vibrio vulnificus]|nr:hypothetical protein [Vibrio vulnificus]
MAFRPPFLSLEFSSLEGVSLVAEHGKRYLYASQIPQSQYELEKNISVIRLLRKNKQYKNKRQKKPPESGWLRLFKAIAEL